MFVIDIGSAVEMISSAVFNKISLYVDLKLYPTDPGFKFQNSGKALFKIEGVVDIRHFIGTCILRKFKKMD